MSGDSGLIGVHKVVQDAKLVHKEVPGAFTGQHLNSVVLVRAEQVDAVPLHDHRRLHVVSDVLRHGRRLRVQPRHRPVQRDHRQLRPGHPSVLYRHRGAQPEHVRRDAVRRALASSANPGRRGATRRVVLAIYFKPRREQHWPLNSRLKDAVSS